MKRFLDCRFLLGSLVALLMAFPFLTSIARPLLLVIPVSVVFVAGVVAADADPRRIRRAVVIAVAQVGLTLASFFARSAETIYVISVSLALVAMGALILFATDCVLGYVLKARVITRDQIYAGICMYLMLGFAFGAVLYLVNIVDPNSYATAGCVDGEAPDLMYFSFVTLATLGYGDITPVTRIARSLAVLEALVGMLYIAVFMARLVSMRSSNTETE